MEDKLSLYNFGREVPNTAKKTINGGRLNGFTDINPMWRIKKLTEMFGPSGEGWYIKILNTDYIPYQRQENEEQMVQIYIELYYKLGDVWQNPVLGIGGAKLVSKERGGLYFDDEAVKKAYTDAIGVACKALGIGADVYWDKDSTDKYQNSGIGSTGASKNTTPPVSSDEPKMLERHTRFSEACNGFMKEDEALTTFRAIIHKNDATIESMTDEEFEKCMARLISAKAK